MSLGDAAPGRLRDAAAGLHGAGQRVQEDAGRLRALSAAVEPVWWGPHSVLWREQATAVASSAGHAASALGGAGAATAALADALEQAQAELRALDLEADRLRARTGADLALWLADPPDTRGPAPDPGPGLALLDARRGQVEARAEEAAAEHAGALGQALAGLSAGPSAVSVLRSVFDVAVGVPSAVVAVGAAARAVARRPGTVLPPRVLEVGRGAGRVLGPVGVLFSAQVAVQGSGNGGVRGAVDRGVAVADVAVFAAGALGSLSVTGAAGTSLALAAAGPVGITVLGAVAAYSLGTFVWDHWHARPAAPRTGARPGAPRVAPRVPPPRTAPVARGWTVEPEWVAQARTVQAPSAAAGTVGPTSPVAGPGPGPVAGPGAAAPAGDPARSRRARGGPRRPEPVGAAS